MSGRRGILVSAILVFLVTVVGASSATAATKRFHPLDFIPRSASMNVLRSPVGIGAVAAAAEFATPLELPPGVRITGIRMYSNGVAATRTAAVGGINSSGGTTAAIATTSDASPDLLTPMLTEGSLNPDPALRTIQPNFNYVVLVFCQPATAVWAVDVDYVR